MASHDTGSVSSRNSKYTLLFVYGTLKREYCNHFHIQIDGVDYFQDAITMSPYLLYVDQHNRNRPCLADTDFCGGEPDSPTSSVHSEMADSSGLEQTDRTDELGSNSLSRLGPNAASIHSEESTAPSQSEVKESANSNRQSSSSEPDNFGRPVCGELYMVSHQLLPVLDEFERVPCHYSRKKIRVKGLKDHSTYFAEVYFNNTARDRFEELRQGKIELLENYTLEHHKSYAPRADNTAGQTTHSRLFALRASRHKVDNDSRCTLHVLDSNANKTLAAAPHPPYVFLQRDG